MNGYEKVVGDDRESIQLAGFPNKRRGEKITPLMMEGEHSRVCALGMFQETHTPAFSISIYPLYI